MAVDPSRTLRSRAWVEIAQRWLEGLVIVWPLGWALHQAGHMQLGVAVAGLGTLAVLAWAGRPRRIDEIARQLDAEYDLAGTLDTAVFWSRRHGPDRARPLLDDANDALAVIPPRVLVAPAAWPMLLIAVIALRSTDELWPTHGGVATKLEEGGVPDGRVSPSTTAPGSARSGAAGVDRGEASTTVDGLHIGATPAFDDPKGAPETPEAFPTQGLITGLGRADGLGLSGVGTPEPGHTDLGDGSAKDGSGGGFGGTADAMTAQSLFLAGTPKEVLLQTTHRASAAEISSGDRRGTTDGTSASASASASGDSPARDDDSVVTNGDALPPAIQSVVERYLGAR